MNNSYLAELGGAIQMMNQWDISVQCSVLFVIFVGLSEVGKGFPPVATIEIASPV